MRFNSYTNFFVFLVTRQSNVITLVETLTSILIIPELDLYLHSLSQIEGSRQIEVSVWFENM